MIDQNLIDQMSQVRYLLEKVGFKIVNPDDTHSSSLKDEQGQPYMLGYQYNMGKHYVDILVHQNTIETYASFVHYWDSDPTQIDYGNGLGGIINTLTNWNKDKGKPSWMDSHEYTGNMESINA